MVSVTPSFAPTQEGVYKEADIALYIAKERKRTTPEALNLERRYLGGSPVKVVDLEETRRRSSVP